MPNALILKLEQRAHLTAEEKAALLGTFQTTKRYRAGEDMVRPGDRPHSSTVVIDGFCARYGGFDDGRRLLTALHISGDFVDLHSLLIKTMDHGIVALTDCLVAQAPHAALRAISEDHPHLSRVLWLDTLVDGSIHRQWLVSLGRRPAVGRLAHLFCELSARLEAIGEDGGDFAFPLTQSTLGDILGLSTVHVNRVAQDLRAQGLISWRNGRVSILDRGGLVRVGEFDPTYLRQFRDEV